MKRLRAVFELTVPEQRVVVVLLLAVVAFVSWKTSRSAGELKREPTPSATAPAATTPVPVNEEK